MHRERSLTASRSRAARCRPAAPFPGLLLTSAAAWPRGNPRTQRVGERRPVRVARAHSCVSLSALGLRWAAQALSEGTADARVTGACEVGRLGRRSGVPLLLWDGGATLRVQRGRGQGAAVRPHDGALVGVGTNLAEQVVSCLTVSSTGPSRKA